MVHYKTKCLFFTIVATLSVFIIIQSIHRYNFAMPILDISRSARLPQPPTISWFQQQIDTFVTQRSEELLSSRSSKFKCDKALYYFKNIDTLFTEVPKSGCTNWKELLLVANGNLVIGNYVRKQDGFIGRLVRKLKLKLTQLGMHHDNAVFSESFKFAVVRNPFTRIVSGYRDKLTRNDSNYTEEGVRQSILTEIRGQTSGPYNSTPTFHEFVSWLVKHRGSGNVHFKPQTKILCLPMMKYNYIVPLEFSEVLSKELCDKMGITTTLREQYDGLSDPHVQSSTKFAKEEFPKLDKWLIEELYDIFRLDFEMLSYSNFTHPDFPLPMIS